MLKRGRSESQESASSHSSSSGSELDSDELAKLRSYAKASATKVNPPPSANLSLGGLNSEGAVVSAVQRLKEELLKPVQPVSGALVVVDAEDESAETLSKLVASKLPKVSREETKKLRKLKQVDHALQDYPAIQKDFYVTPPDVKQLSPEEVKSLLKELDGAKISGRDVPRPMRSWHGSGLPERVLEALRVMNFANPFAVQSIACPVLMSGRDLLVTAKTGSGKTLSYALPLVRHCVSQGRCEKGQGPIGLILVPTQELAVQVFSLVSDLCKCAGIRCVSSYGSTSLTENIQQAKQGCEVMVCTPGRLLDLLTSNNGGTVTLFRVSFVVIDEADRLFDSGFMEHVEAFLKNIRPDRQLAMISATLPKELRKVLLRHLKDPVEVSVGGRPSPSTNVDQAFYFFDEDVYEADWEKREEGERFKKLLEILGHEGDGTKLILIFTQRKEEVDELMARLSTLGYQNRIATLYSGMDPVDREFALEHFSPGNQFILIATSLAERGLDIPFLELVVNYVLPNHYEAYVHRIGRTGRAGKSGRAVNFFTRGKDDDIAPELVGGLERAGQPVPDELAETAARVVKLRKEGLASGSVSFYRGYQKAKKMKLETRDHKDKLQQAAKAAGLDGVVSLSSSENDSDAEGGDFTDDIVQVRVGENNAKEGALTLHNPGALSLASGEADNVKKALEYAQKTTSVLVSDEDSSAVRFTCEYPVNDLPAMIRSKLQSGAFLRSIADECKTSIIKKGIYFDPKKKHSHRLKDGERPLYLLIVGQSAEAVQEARSRLNETRDSMLEKVRKKASAIGAEL